MKKLIFILAMVFPVITFAQGHEGVWKQTKFDELASRTGSLVKFTDIPVPNFPLYFGGAVKTYIRTCLTGEEYIFLSYRTAASGIKRCDD